MTQYCYCLCLLLILTFTTINAQEFSVGNLSLGEGVGYKSYQTFHQQSSAYFIAPSAYNVEEGAGYFQNSELVVNRAEYGFSDQFNLQAGFIPLILVGQNAAVLWISPKFAAPVIEDQINVAGGPVVIATFAEGTEYIVAAGYGVVTFGSRDRNVSLGIAYGHLDWEWADAPFFAVSSLFRVTDKVYLISENHIFQRDNIKRGYTWAGNLSLGARIVWKRFSLDLGVGHQLLAESGSDYIPWLSFSLPFGNY